MLVAISSNRKFTLDALFGEANSFTIGRNSSSELTMAAMVGGEGPSDSIALTLSRKHAKLTVLNGNLGVEDTGTMNGTYVNNHRLQTGERKVLSHGDVLSLGGPQCTHSSRSTVVNPFSLRVYKPETFLASHVVPRRATPPRAASASQSAAGPSSDPAVEVFSFRASGSNPGTQPINSQPTDAVVPRPNQIPNRTVNAAAAPAAAPAPVDDVIDLTGLDDSPEKAPRQRQQQQRGEDREQQNAKRMRLPRPAYILVVDSPPREEPVAPPPPPAPAAAAGPSNPANDMVARMKEQFTCPICQDMIVAAHGLVPCGHCFCGACLVGWLRQRKSDCPTCRKVTTAPPVRQHNIDNAIEALAPQLSEEDKAVMNEKKEDWEKNKVELQKVLQGGGPQQQQQQQRGRGQHANLNVAGRIAQMMAGDFGQFLGLHHAGLLAVPTMPTARPAPQTARSGPVRQSRRQQAAAAPQPQAPSGSRRGYRIVTIGPPRTAQRRCLVCNSTISSGNCLMDVNERSTHVSCVPPHVWVEVTRQGPLGNVAALSQSERTYVQRQMQIVAVRTRNSR